GVRDDDDERECAGEPRRRVRGGAPGRLDTGRSRPGAGRTPVAVGAGPGRRVTNARHAHVRLEPVDGREAAAARPGNDGREASGVARPARRAGRRIPARLTAGSGQGPPAEVTPGAGRRRIAGCAARDWRASLLRTVPGPRACDRTGRGGSMAV